MFYNRKLTLINFQKRASIAKNLYHKYNVDYDGKYLLSSFVAIENALTEQHTSINTVKPEQFTEIASDMLYSAATATDKHVNFDKLRNAVLAIIDYRGFYLETSEKTRHFSGAMNRFTSIQ